MNCRKCNGTGTVTKLTQRGGPHCHDANIGLAIMTLGLSLLATTTTKYSVCPVCSGTGKSLSYWLKKVMK